jgi:hypothetical protein
VTGLGANTAGFKDVEGAFHGVLSFGEVQKYGMEGSLVKGGKLSSKIEFNNGCRGVTAGTETMKAVMEWMQRVSIMASRIFEIVSRRPILREPPSGLEMMTRMAQWIAVGRLPPV